MEDFKFPEPIDINKIHLGETLKQKLGRILKTIGKYIWIGLQWVYKYLPIMVVGFLGLYLFVQALLVVCSLCGAQWTHELAKASPLKCFQHAHTFWGCTAKLTLYVFLCKLFMSTIKMMSELSTQKEDTTILYYVPAAFVVGIFYCIFNNNLYNWVAYGSIVLFLIVTMFDGWSCPKRYAESSSSSGGGGGGGCSSSDDDDEFEYKSTLDHSNWERIAEERRLNQEGKEQEYQQRQAEEDARRKEEERKANTIVYAIQKTKESVEIRLENGHTFQKWGTLICSTSSTVTILDHDWYRVYNAKGSQIQARHK